MFFLAGVVLRVCLIVIVWTWTGKSGGERYWESGVLFLGGGMG